MGKMHLMQTKALAKTITLAIAAALDTTISSALVTAIFFLSVSGALGCNHGTDGCSVGCCVTVLEGICGIMFAIQFADVSPIAAQPSAPVDVVCPKPGASTI